MTIAEQRPAQEDGCLRDADRLVRALTFELGSVPADPLLAAWPGFVAASAQVLALLRPAGTPGAAVLRREVSRWGWAPPAAVEAEPGLMAAEALLQQAGQQLEQHHAWAAPVPDPRAGHVLGIVCVAAHVVGASAREHLDTLVGSDRESGRDTYARLIAQVALVEDYALTAIQHAGRSPWPAEPPTRDSRAQEPRQDRGS